MWRMQVGDRAMTDAEWALFATALDVLREFVEEDIREKTDDAYTGVPVFDHLTAEQKLVLLADVAHALRDPALPTPTHTAANEGTIAAVFSIMCVELEMELDVAELEGADDKPTEVRRMLRAVCDRDDEQGEEPLPDETSTELEEWNCLLEEFKSVIFWDADFTLGNLFLDLPPDEVQEKMKLCNIDPEYYLAVPDEPNEARLIVARQTLAQLLGLPVPDDHGHYPALEDLFHNLTLAPCSPDQIAAWEGNPWIEVVIMAKPVGDCNYPTWAARFSQALPPTPFQLTPPASPEEAPDLPSGLRTEHRGDIWVVRNAYGSYWCGLVENGWTDKPYDEDFPALAFPTETEARAAYAQADGMYSDRMKRHKQAMEVLGLADA